MIKNFKIFKKYNLNKNTVDYNKIYTLYYDNRAIIIGKISNNPGNGIRDIGCILTGYNSKGEEAYHLILRRDSWKFIREATPDEIDTYELLDKSNKYNI